MSPPEVTKKIEPTSVGPGLAQFGVAGALADPKIQLFQDSTLIQSNDDWDFDLRPPVFSQLGAFALLPASKDAALLVTVAPGNYTAQLSGLNGTTGIALIEVYEVP